MGDVLQPWLRPSRVFSAGRGGGTDPHFEKSEFGLGDIAMSTEVSGCE